MKKFLLNILLVSALFAQTETEWHYLSHENPPMTSAIPYFTTYNMVEKGDTIFIAGGDDATHLRFGWYPGTGTEVKWSATELQHGAGNYDMNNDVARLGNTVTGIVYYAGGTTNSTDYSIDKLNLGKTLTNITETPPSSSIYGINSNTNYDTLYIYSAVQIDKSADGINWTPMGATTRSVLHGVAAGSDYIHTSYFVKDTLWIGTGFNYAYNGFSDASNNDTAGICYYVPSKGQLYVDKRNLGNNRMVKWFRGFGYANHKLYALLDSPTDTSVNGLWRRDAPGTWTKCAIPNIGNAQAIGIAADTVGGRLFIALGKTTLDTALNRIWVYTPSIAQWRKLPRIGSPTAGQTYPGNAIHDTMAVSGSRLYYHANTNRLYVLVSGRWVKDVLDGAVVAGSKTVYNPNGGSQFYMNYYDLDIPGSLTLTAPVGGEVFHQDSVANITWTSTSISSFNVYYRLNGTSSWVLIGSPSASPQAWTIPDSVYTLEAQVKVESDDALFSDISDVFAILPDSRITILYPRGLTNLNKSVGDTIRIRFESIFVDSAKIWWSKDSTTWYYIGKAIVDTVNDAYKDTTLYIWAIPYGVITNVLYIKIRQDVDTTIYFTPKTYYTDLGQRAYVSGAFQAPVWWSPPFEFNGDWYTVYIQSIGWGYFGSPLAGIGYYLDEISTPQWSASLPVLFSGDYIDDELGRVCVPGYNAGEIYAPYPGGISTWLYRIDADTIDIDASSGVRFRIFTNGSSTIGSSYCLQGGDAIPANIPMIYSDPVVYLNRSYTKDGYNITQTDLTNSVTTIYADLQDLGLMTDVRLKSTYEIYRMGNKIIATNPSRTGYAVNYSFDVLSIPYDGTDVAEDATKSYSAVYLKRYKFRGIHPKAFKRPL